MELVGMQTNIFPKALFMYYSVFFLELCILDFAYPNN